MDKKELLKNSIVMIGKRINGVTTIKMVVFDKIVTLENFI